MALVCGYRIANDVNANSIRPSDGAFQEHVSLLYESQPRAYAQCFTFLATCWYVFRVK